MIAFNYISLGSIFGECLYATSVVPLQYIGDLHDWDMQEQTV